MRTEIDSDLERLSGKTILVTGATGLIGKELVKTMADWNVRHDGSISIAAAVRDSSRAETIFGDDTARRREGITLLVGDIRSLDFQNIKADYIIHAASQTSSRAFVDYPVETIRVAFDGTCHVLEYAVNCSPEKFVYLSTMEIYGAPDSDETIDEGHGTNLDLTAIRSCYPESKRLCENLCFSYGREHHFPVNTIRLTQTFGNGVEWDDARVFAEFGRCAVEKRDIVLKTRGETWRSYLHVRDAVRAILAVALRGRDGEAYNAANETTYCSIYEMAQLVTANFGDGRMSVVVREQEENTSAYAPVLRMNLETSKLRTLGWEPEFDLTRMFEDMIADFPRK